MDTALLKKLESEPLPRVLVVHGEETMWRERVYDVLKRRSAQDGFGEWNWSVFHGAKDFNLEPLLTELAMLPWGESSKTVVLRDAHLVSAETMEKLARWLEDNPRANCLALFFEQVDERLRFWKTLRPPSPWRSNAIHSQESGWPVTWRSIAPSGAKRWKGPRRSFFWRGWAPISM